MKSIRLIRFAAAMLLTVSCALFVVGCATDGTDDVSERPWNDTQGWQGGLPSGLNEGR